MTGPRLRTAAAAVVLAGLAAGTSCRGEGAPLTPRHASGRRVVPHDVQSASTDLAAPTRLDGMTLEQVVAFRRDRVAAQAGLRLFPRDYDPLRGPSAPIWNRMTPGARWLAPTVYYVANPSVLVVLVCANHVTALNLSCPEVSITCAQGHIEERREGASARCWLDRVHDPPYADHPGAVRVVMVNAYDAGFRFAHVDRRLSLNVLGEADPRNIVNGLFSQSSFFHVGSHQANNISPEDPRGWIHLQDPRAATRIHVKLWREPPASLEHAADVVYEALVLPDGGPRPR